jgi:hypothetical protein
VPDGGRVPPVLAAGFGAVDPVLQGVVVSSVIGHSTLLHQVVVVVTDGDLHDGGEGGGLIGALDEKQVRLTLAKAIAMANLRRAAAGNKPITMNSLAVQAGVAAAALSLNLASKIVTVLDCGIEDLLEVVEA